MRASLAAKLPSRRRVMRDLGVVRGAAAAPPRGRSALAQPMKKLVYVVWAFEPQTHREHADRFETANPLQGRNGHRQFSRLRKKVLAMINAGDQIDAMLVC
jgi:hypothetical protein